MPKPVKIILMIAAVALAAFIAYTQTQLLL